MGLREGRGGDRVGRGWGLWERGLKGRLREMEWEEIGAGGWWGGEVWRIDGGGESGKGDGGRGGRGLGW